MPKPNTPADDYWILYVSISPPYPEERLPIAFLPTGEIDMAHTSAENLTTANNLLAPTTQFLQQNFGNSTLDIWQFFNWIFVVYYWSFLADVGQIAPTGYDLTNPLSPLPVPFPSTNNIFINETLFTIYANFYNNTLSPLVQSKFGPQPPPVLLNDETRLQPSQTTLLRSYTCTHRQLKGSLNFIISVIVADYALLMGGYNLISFIMGWLQRRKDEGTLFQR